VFPPGDKTHPRGFLAVHDLFGKPVPIFPDHARPADAEAYAIFGGRKTTPGPRPLNTA
jgi:hypothetical protein